MGQHGWSCCREPVQTKCRSILTSPLNAQPEIPAVGGGTAVCLGRGSRVRAQPLWAPGAQWGHRMPWLKHTVVSLIQWFLCLNCRDFDKCFMLLLRQKYVLVKLWNWCVLLYLFKKKHVLKAKEPLLCGVFSQTGAYTLHQGPTIHNKNQWFSYCKTRYTPFTVIITFKTLHCNGCY